MKVTIADRQIRVPINSGPNLIDTGRVDARVFSDRIAVHPSLNHPGAGVWMVSLASTGQGLMELPTREEAECFTLELLKDVECGKVYLDVDPNTVTGLPAVSVDVNALTLFCAFWGERRKLVLPAYLAKVTIPEGIVVTGWKDREKAL